MCTREELQIYLKEILHVELSDLQKQLQRGVRAEMQDIFKELQQVPYRCGTPSKSLELQQVPHRCGTPSKSLKSNGKKPHPCLLDAHCTKVEAPVKQHRLPATDEATDALACMIDAKEDPPTACSTLETIRLSGENSAEISPSSTLKSRSEYMSRPMSPPMLPVVPIPGIPDVQPPDHFQGKPANLCLDEEIVDLTSEKSAPNSPGLSQGPWSGVEASQATLSPRKRFHNSSRRNSLTSMPTQMSLATLESRPPPLRRLAIHIVSHSKFDYLVASLILLNGIAVGIQTDYLARTNSEEPPIVFQVIEMVFCILFSVELYIRLIAYRLKFFSTTQRAWNIFDFIVVKLQWIEIIMSLVASGHDTPGFSGMSFNVLRILRLIRIVRLARALRLIGELRTIVSSILGSVKPLFWTAVLLCLVAYVVGVALTQLVHNKRLSMIERGEEIPQKLDLYWGHLGSTIFTLILTITGGVDWNDACRPLMDKIGMEVSIVFIFYILFSSLAMLNVVTGVFIDAVMENGRKAKETCTKQNVENLFTVLDVNHENFITWEVFEKQLDRQEMKEFFHIVDVDIANARNLFDLLDQDDSGTIDAEEFMDGCLRLWQPAKDLDLRLIARDITRVRRRIQDLHCTVHEVHDCVTPYMSSVDSVFKLKGG